MCMGELDCNSKLQIEYTGEKEINFNFVNNILQSFFFLLDIGSFKFRLKKCE